MFQFALYVVLLCSLNACDFSHTNSKAPENIDIQNAAIENVEFIEQQQDSDDNIDASKQLLNKSDQSGLVEIGIKKQETHNSSNYLKPKLSNPESMVLSRIDSQTREPLFANSSYQAETTATNIKEVVLDHDPASNIGSTSDIVDITDTESEDLVWKISHSEFDALLQKYVSRSGKVDYKGFKSDIAILDQYLTKIASIDINDSYSRKEKLAYWINAYNAFTIKLIVQNYPVQSITDLHKGKPWDEQWIEINGKTYSLNNIENDIIRPVFKEPRIHFAVNCAAASCPPLLNKAYRAATLENTLHTQAINFINNRSYNSIDGKSVQLSKIFEWYAGDFGELRNYVNKYLKTPLSEDVDILFKDYDWSLNN